MDETIYVIFKVQFDFALEVWFRIYQDFNYKEHFIPLKLETENIDSNSLCRSFKDLDMPCKKGFLKLYWPNIG